MLKVEQTLSSENKGHWPWWFFFPLRVNQHSQYIASLESGGGTFWPQIICRVRCLQGNLNNLPKCYCQPYLSQVKMIAAGVVQRLYRQPVSTSSYSTKVKPEKGTQEDVLIRGAAKWMNEWRHWIFFSCCIAHCTSQPITRPLLLFLLCCSPRWYIYIGQLTLLVKKIQYSFFTMLSVRCYSHHQGGLQPRQHLPSRTTGQKYPKYELYHLALVTSLQSLQRSDWAGDPWYRVPVS